MERERGGGDGEVEHEVDGEEVREEARREDVAEDLGQIELGRVWHDRESERLKRMRSARPDRPGAGRAPATSPAPSVSPKRNGYLLRYFSGISDSEPELINSLNFGCAACSCVRVRVLWLFSPLLSWRLFCETPLNPASSSHKRDAQ